MSNNNLRELCLKIMIENEDRDEFREFIIGCGRYEDDDDQDECLLVS